MLNFNIFRMSNKKNKKVLIIMLIHHLCMTDDLIAYKTYKEY